MVDPSELIFTKVAAVARQRPGAVAVVSVGPGHAPQTLTWRELYEGAVRTAALLRSLDVQPGEPVAYQLQNRVEFVTLSVAITMVGAVCEPLMPIFRERELQFMLDRSHARVLFVPASFKRYDHHALAQTMRGRCPALEHVVTFDLDYDELVAHAVAAPAGAATATESTPPLDAIAQLLFTSGSTGEPKGVLNSHRALNQAIAIHSTHFGLTADDVIYSPSPLAHQTGFLYGMWLALLLGAKQVIQDTWDPQVALTAMHEQGITFVQAATPFLADLVRNVQQGGGVPAALRLFVATGAAIPRELARDARSVLEAEVGGAWGSTESCLGTAFVPGQDPELAWQSDGHALDGITVRIVDDDGRPLPAGTEGNFELLSPTMFEGYLERADLTAEVMTADGYYRTGDLARLDADGYLHITGRVKDVINRGGEKVPVAEIEQLLFAHPAVRDVAIVAMPDPRLGERACAFVVPEDGAALKFGEMQQYLEQQRVAKPYWPERLELVDALPQTPSGKTQKFLLRELTAKF
jgi:3-phosphoshikimate 1-carboxyvinyltransferase